MLQGVLANTDPRYSRAIIAVNAEPPKTYGIGQVLENTDARLRTIEDNLVLIERNGVLESLPLLRTAQDNATRSAPGPAPPIQPAHSTPPSLSAPTAPKLAPVAPAAAGADSKGKPAAGQAGAGQPFPFGGAQE